MFQNKKVNKIIVMALCFSIFFLFGTSVFGITSVIKKKIEDLILDWFAMIIMGLGDAVLHLICYAVGESVTIDKLIFNDVNKVSADFWTDSNNTLRHYMRPVISNWYNVFLKIAVMVYVIVLVYIGIQILLSSTGGKKAKYSTLLVDWCVGILILFVFPVAMKYIVRLNNATVQALGSYQSFQSGSGVLADHSIFELLPHYGQKTFASYVGDVKGDTMALTRHAAADKDSDETDGKTRIMLGLVYLVLIGETIAVLIIYYKRVFMLAFLVTIFPLVAMTYVIDRLRRWKKSNI